MTYNVFSGTLNPTQSQSQPNEQPMNRENNFDFLPNLLCDVNGRRH